MALFELDNGRLVPAQFGREISDGFTPEVLHAVRSQVLEIVSRPLFPITWGDIGGTAAGDLPRLTSLDASGQVVAVEVMETLDADLLIESLSRLADTAAMSWVGLAREYPGGVDRFKMDWAQFREAMPPTTPNGPRLIIVASSIDPEVRPALDVLASSGVEVHEMTLRQMSNGRAFLDVSAVGPRTYGHRANLLAGDSTHVSEIKEKVEQKKVEAQTARKLTSAAPLAQTPPESDPGTPDVLRRRTPPAPPRRPARQETAAAPFPSRRERRGETTKIPGGSEPLKQTSGALVTVAKMVGRPTPLALDSDLGLAVDSLLQPSGILQVGNREYTDPTEALHSLGFGGMNGWDAWRIGDRYGPTLAEAIEEINRDR